MVCVFGAESQTHTVSFIQRLHRQVVNAVQPKPKARPILRMGNDLISIVVILSPKFPKLSNLPFHPPYTPPKSIVETTIIASNAITVAEKGVIKEWSWQAPVQKVGPGTSWVGGCDLL